MTATNPPSMTPKEATAALHAHLALPMDGLSMPDHLLAGDLLDAGADINARDREGLPPPVALPELELHIRRPRCFQNSLS